MAHSDDKWARRFVFAPRNPNRQLLASSNNANEKEAKRGDDELKLSLTRPHPLGLSFNAYWCAVTPATVNQGAISGKCCAKDVSRLLGDGFDYCERIYQLVKSSERKGNALSTTRSRARLITLLERIVFVRVQRNSGSIGKFYESGETNFFNIASD